MVAHTFLGHHGICTSIPFVVVNGLQLLMQVQKLVVHYHTLLVLLGACIAGGYEAVGG